MTIADMSDERKAEFSHKLYNIIYKYLPKREEEEEK